MSHISFSALKNWNQCPFYYKITYVDKIKGLLFNLFESQWPSLFNKPGFIKSMLTPIVKVKKKFRTRLLIRSKKDELIQKKVGVILTNLKISKKIKLTVDVDPINFA